MFKKLAGSNHRQEGATAIEYALMVVVIALVMVVGAKVLGTNLSDSFSSTGAKVTGTP